MNIKQEKAQVIDGLKTFYEFEELKAFGSDLLRYYEARVEQYSQRLDTMLRQQSNGKGVVNKPQSHISSGWIRVGTLVVNMSNPVQATTELLFKLLEDAKAKLDATKSFLESLESVLNIGANKEVNYLLCVRNGVPEKIILEERKRGKEFNYNVKLQVVSD
ncbi:MAG: hypothetical protein QXN08_04385 [Nitrososphaerales archaeon]